MGEVVLRRMDTWTIIEQKLNEKNENEVKGL